MEFTKTLVLIHTFQKHPELLLSLLHHPLLSKGIPLLGQSFFKYAAANFCIFDSKEPFIQLDLLLSFSPGGTGTDPNLFIKGLQAGGQGSQSESNVQGQLLATARSWC